MIPHSLLADKEWLAADYHGPTPIVHITKWMIVAYQDNLIRIRIYRPWGNDLETTPPPIWIYHQDFQLADPDFDNKLAHTITVALRSPPLRWREELPTDLERHQDLARARGHGQEPLAVAEDDHIIRANCAL
jgi:hypothetical protein